jgi:hypothetical protein
MAHVGIIRRARFIAANADLSACMPDLSRPAPITFLTAGQRPAGYDGVVRPAERFKKIGPRGIHYLSEYFVRPTIGLLPVKRP